jgi:hypothetical protein
LIRAVRAAGYDDVEIVHKYPSLYQDVTDPSDAMEFGTMGITFWAHKPEK